MANLFIRMILDQAQYKKGLQDASKELKVFVAANEAAKLAVKGLGGVAAFAGIATGLGDAARMSVAFEKSLSNMKAQTGATGEELAYFKQEAIRLGSATTQTASEVVKAFQLVGSNKAELLGNKEALTAVTESAIVLAEAALIDVPEAADALTGALNQMGEGAEHAEEYINILAAASQKGSAAIPYLNTAIEKAGGTANATGVKFNTLVAAIEAIAPKITDASSAGTNLRNILLTLESSADRQLKPSVVGLGNAVKHLADMHLDATQMTKMFGKESVTAALALVNEKEKFLELEQAITGTNTAFEQQRANNDNLAGSINGLQSAWEGFILTLNNSNGVLKGIVDELASLVNTARDWFLTSDQLRGEQNRGRVKIAKDTARERIGERMAGGMSLDEAAAAERKNAQYMYPKAAEYEEKLALYQQKKNELEQHWEGLRAKNLEKLKEEVAEAKNEKEAYDAVLGTIESLVKEQEALANKQKETARMAGTTAATATTGKGKKGFTQEEIVRMQAVVDTGLQYQTPLGAKVLKAMQGDGTLEVVKIPIEIDENIEEANDALEEMAEKRKNLEKTADALGSVGSIMGSLGGIAQSFGDSFAAGLLGSLGAVAEMIAKLQGMAVAEGVASAAKLAFPANLAAMATVVATISSIFSQLNFAEGGIVPGMNYTDGITARVSSGEMVMNQADQKRLFDAIHTGQLGGGKSRTVISGEQIVTVVNNYGKRTGKGTILRG